MSVTRRGSVRQRHGRDCPREPNGSLAVHRCKKTWEYVVDLGRDGAGRRRQLTKSGFRTRRDATLAMQRCLDDLRGGIDVEVRMTVERYLNEWLESKRSLRPSTLSSYRQQIRMYLAPLLGHIPLQDLRPRHVDLMITELTKPRGERSLKPATVRRIHSTLRSALNDAVRRRLLSYNAAQHVELPSEDRFMATVWDAEQVARFLDATKEHRDYPLFHLVVMTGLRRGEVCGLRWRDVDLERGFLRVAQSVVEIGGKLHVGLPKTRSGVRTVPLDALSVELLRFHVDRQREEKARWGAAYEDNDLGFARENGALLQPERLSFRFRDACRRAGVPVIRFHDLRHTSASLALAAGVAMKVVSERLGHSTTAITADLYTHVVPTVARDAAEAIARTIQPRASDAAGERTVSAEPLTDPETTNPREGA